MKLKDRKILFNSKTELMGVVNITPDSFYDGGKFYDLEAATERVMELVESGASFIDIGGESTRPSSKPVSEKEELDRILPLIKAIKGKLQ